MKQWLHDVKIVAPLYFVWLAMLWGIALAAPFLWPLREGFLGPLRWANFDGVHYLTIAARGYFQYGQAFFPVYPLLIRGLLFLPIDPVYIALGISHLTFLAGLIVFYRLSYNINKMWGIWPVIFLLVFPTSFFFASVYTESLFFLLAVSIFYLAEKKQWLWVGILGLVISATRLFGIFLVPALMFFKKPSKWILLVPIGLFLYMWYLYRTAGDPLFFFHAQPAFGAGRSGSSLILLPQVLWRYTKIITTASPTTISYKVAVLELISLCFSGIALWIGFAKKIIPRSYLLFSLFIVVVPTLTGTLSSLPRYLLSAFPLFFIVGSVHNTALKVLLFAIFLGGLFFMGTLFWQGYFVS